MGTRQARRQRAIERAHERYAGTLLAVGLPRRAVGASAGDVRFADGEYLWYDNEWRSSIMTFYLAAHIGNPTPTDKTVKKFVRGFVSWVRRESEARRHV